MFLIRFGGSSEMVKKNNIICKNVALGNEFSYKNKIKKLNFDLL